MTRRSWRRRLLFAPTLTLAAYLLIAYVLLPRLWSEEDARAPTGDMVTRTAQGEAGDPINIGFAATPAALVTAFRDAGWHPADPITFETSVAIVGSVLFDRPDPDAPVSPLFYEGRREDLAFEKPVGTSADRRQHVRLWRIERAEVSYLGSVTFDEGVGLSHYTGAVTHRIAPDIDAARDALASDMERAGVVSATRTIEGVGATQTGRNGEGDPYFTDGEARILVLEAE